jgi:hypothetical protein
VNFDQPSNDDVSSTSNPTFGSGPRNATTDSESDQQFDEPPEEPRVIGDFDGSSNALWTLFRDEAKSHDDARINTLKEDMESALIFVRSVPTADSVVLTRDFTGRVVFCYPYHIRAR